MVARQFDEILDRIKDATGARTQVQLADILGIRQSSISDAKRRNSVPADWYLKLYRTHGLNPDWLSDGIDPMYLKPGFTPPEAVKERKKRYGASDPSRGRVVQVSTMTGRMEEEEWQPEYIGQLSIPETLYMEKLLVVQMDGTSMEPLVRRGAHVGIDTSQKRILSGEIYAVNMPHEGLILRRVFFDADMGRFVLRSENQNHPEQTLSVERKETDLVGRIVWVIQDF